MGLDSECDVVVDSRRPGNAHASASIASLRRSLLAEHLGLETDTIEDRLVQHHSMREAIEGARDERGRHLRRYHPPELSEVERRLAESELLDPERPEDMFEPFAKGGLFRKGSRLTRIRERLHWRRKAGK
jgi:hypothetical protein